MNDIITQQPADWDCVFTSTDPLFENDQWCAQEKLDGVKVVLFCENGNLRGESRTGRRMELSAKTRALMPVQGNFIIEGEQGNRLTGDTGFIAFDVIAVDGQDVRHLEYDNRLSILSMLEVPMIHTVYGTAAKRRLHVAVHAKGGEGIVFKRTDAKYRPGKTSAQLKLKNWKSDTFRVVTADGQGIELMTLDGRPAGRCPGFVQAGKLVEVRYQEVTEAGKLRCPTLIGVRDDIA